MGMSTSRLSSPTRKAMARGRMQPVVSTTATESGFPLSATSPTRRFRKGSSARVVS